VPDAEIKVFHFRGGPLDGRLMPIPVTQNREWSIPTVDGVWLGDVDAGLPEDLTTIDYRHEDYLRVGEGDDAEYVHQTLVTLDDEPPPSWRHKLN
jgi:hypothetical protein